jgi:hypothetical protein
LQNNSRTHHSKRFTKWEERAVLQKTNVCLFVEKPHSSTLSVNPNPIASLFSGLIQQTAAGAASVVATLCSAIRRAGGEEAGDGADVSAEEESYPSDTDDIAGIVGLNVDPEPQELETTPLPLPEDWSEELKSRADVNLKYEDQSFQHEYPSRLKKYQKILTR